MPRILLATLVLSLVGCAGQPVATWSEPSPLAPVAPVPAGSRSEAAQREIDLLEAVYRYQFTHNASSATHHGRAEVYFLSGPGKQDPAAELLARFAGHTPPVAPASAAGSKVWYGVKHGESGAQGIILRVDEIRWIDPDTAEVEGGYYENSRSASENTYRVARKDGRWTVVNDRMNSMS